MIEKARDNQDLQESLVKVIADCRKPRSSEEKIANSNNTNDLVTLAAAALTAAEILKAAKPDIEDLPIPYLSLRM